MERGAQKYINPYTDYGFKRLFGEEPSKNLLLDFLNELLGEKEEKITKLSYQPTEKLPITVGNRKAIFDIFCTNEKGEQFIVEMQKVEQQYFKDRMLYYSTFPIQTQAKDKAKNWDFELKHVYAIGILDFSFKEENPDPEKYRYDAKITEIETEEVFYDKLTFTYLSMNKFNKKLEDIETKFEKWLYVIKNLEKLDRIPEKLRDSIFLDFFNKAEISQLKDNEYKEYEASLNAYRDIKNSIEFAEKKGIEKGIEQGIEQGIASQKIKVVLKMHAKGYSAEEIAEVTELTINEVKAIIANASSSN